MKLASAPARLAMVRSSSRSLVRKLCVESRALTVVVVVLPIVVFAGTLAHGFVWDDDFNIVNNRDYRGLGWQQLTWMFRAAHHAHWTPVTWMTLGLDYLAWGMEPRGYHLSNILLHAVNAWLLYRIALHLLRLARPQDGPRAIVAGAIAASVFFSVHPLRAESVSWITERRDLVAGCFFLLTILTYLRAQQVGEGAVARWRLASIVSFVAAVMSKSTVVGLPFVLLLLDVYPLRRLKMSPARWLALPDRRILLEKGPYLAIAVLASVLTATIFGSRGYLSTLDSVPFMARFVLVGHGVWFYLWKTLVPLWLSPLYEFPLSLDVRAPELLVPFAAALAVTAILVVFGRRWPSGLAAWLCYLVILAPVSGIVHQGAHLVADRNSYLACLPFAILFGALVTALSAPALSRPAMQSGRGLAALVLVASLLPLAALASHQAAIWRDAMSVWKQAVALDAHCFRCQHNLGLALIRQGDVRAGIPYLQRAAAINPQSAAPRGALVVAHLTAGQREQAVDELRELRSIDRELAADLSPLFVTTW